MATTGVVPTQLGCTSATLDTLVMEDMERKYAAAYSLNLLLHHNRIFTSRLLADAWTLYCVHVGGREGRVLSTMTALVE